MAKIVRIPPAFFSKVSFDGVGVVDSEFVYKSNRCANRWLALTKDAEYPYSRNESKQIQQLLSSGALDELQSCRSGIHVGAADAHKEILIANHVAGNKCGYTGLFLDLSLPLLDFAVRAFVASTSLAAERAVVNVLNDSELHEVIKNSRVANQRPRLFSSFGNTIGNYQGLSILRSLEKVMTAGDCVVFGVHAKVEDGTGQTYPAYCSDGYFDHMRSVLLDIGVQPDLGHLETRVISLNDGLVDSVEIVFSIGTEYQIYVPSSDGHSLKLKEIIVDTSSKFSEHFIHDEISGTSLNTLNCWNSKSLENIVVLCRKK